MHKKPEIVHTVTDYYDGPRGGIADYLGKPHAYRLEWDEAEDDWSGIVLLQAIDDETFRLAMEDWLIWCRWLHAFHHGLTTQATHPALPEERARHEELKAILKPRLQIDPKQAIRVYGKFDVSAPPTPGMTSSAIWFVVWSQVKEDFTSVR